MCDSSKQSEFNTKMWDYIATLEATNESLLDTLKHCVKVLTAMKWQVPDPDGWQVFCPTFQVYKNRTLPEAQPKNQG